MSSPASVEEGCVADSVGTLYLLRELPSCSSDDWLCRGKCLAGHAASCLGMAYVAEMNAAAAQEEYVRLYKRACVLGAANGCTNYAATIWARDHTEGELACAQRIFEKACTAKEPFACGMVGRLMLESTTPPSFAKGRR